MLRTDFPKRNVMCYPASGVLSDDLLGGVFHFMPANHHKPVTDLRPRKREGLRSMSWSAELSEEPQKEICVSKIRYAKLLSVHGSSSRRSAYAKWARFFRFPVQERTLEVNVLE